MFGYCWPLLVLLVFLASSGYSAVSDIRSVTASQTELLFELEAPAGEPLQLFEYRLWEEPTDWHDRTPLWDGEATSQPVHLPRFEGQRDRLFSKFLLVRKATGHALGAPHYITEVEPLPDRRFELPWPKNKKGLQVQLPEDAVDLGLGYAAFGLLVSAVVDFSGNPPEATWEVDGESIPINMAYIRGFDAAFKTLTEAGINCTLIPINGVPSEPHPENPFIHPRTDLAGAPNHLGAFNLTDERGLLHYRAVIEFLADRYTQPDCRYGWISGFVVGNEVQTHWDWHNMGKATLDELIEDYGRTLRVTDLIARSTHPELRTYVSMTQSWTENYYNDPLKGFPGKDFIDKLAVWGKQGGDFPWQVAFHPYPENLFNPRFWDDREATLSFQTPKITFKNIEVLPAYMAQSRLLYKGQPRHIILSEQGFHTEPGEAGEQLQAAALAAAWHKINNTPGIEAFILHRHVDHGQEGGLNLGLWTRKLDDPLPHIPDRKKLSWQVWHDAGTPAWEQTVEFAKPILGIESWDELLPSTHIEGAAESTSELLIAQEGASDYVILTPDEATPTQLYAAKELQYFLKQCSGAELPIVGESEAGAKPAFIIGPVRRSGADRLQARATALAEDGVLLKSVGRDIVLLGQNDRGQLYSVYVLLERYLGVRFLAHDCTVTPKQTTLSLPALEYSYAPPLMYRETLYFDSFPKEIATRQRLNGPKQALDAEVGGKLDFFPYVHSASQLVPPSEFYAEHPEYFSLVGGKRTDQTIHGQLCWTNPDVLRIATERVLKWVKEHPDVPIIDVSQNDGEGACECERCMALVNESGSQHEPIMRFVNAIADVMKERYPDKWVETLAYAYSVKPGTTPPRDNVIIRLCHAGCYFHGFEKCGLGANFSTWLDEWTARCKRVFIWHYATNFAHYLAPNPNLAGLAADLKYYGKSGVNGVMVQGNYQSPGGELAELRQYLASQLMWDPSRDPMQIRLEFCKGYYGKVWPVVWDFLALMDKLAERPDVHGFGAWDPRWTNPDTFCAESLALLEKAWLEADSRELAIRIEKLMLPFWYLQLTWPESYGLTDPEQAAEAVQRVKRLGEECHLTHIREGGENFGPWIAELEALYTALPSEVVWDLFKLRNQAEWINTPGWRPEQVELDGKTQLSLFHHPPEEGVSDGIFHLTLPELASGQRLLLRFGTLLSGDSPNGVGYSLLVEGKEVWRHTQLAGPGTAHEVNLAPWAGREIELRLRVDSLGDGTYDWANWVRPQVVLFQD